MENNIKQKYKLVNKLVETIGDNELIEISRFLGARLECPDSYVVMLGETSSGKTTLLNGLLGENCLYTSVKPSTGAVIELVLNADSEGYSFYAINKNATMEKLLRRDFTDLSIKPDHHLSRLRLVAPSPINTEGSLRLFDTPGYGSMIDQHEKTLSAFLAESNVVLYVVAYKVGIQQDDFNFLNFAAELVADDTEFIVVINRIPDELPENDSRVEEIMEYVSGVLHYTPKVFLVPNVYCEKNEYPLPQCEELWQYVQQVISSDKQKQQLENSFNGYIYGLLEKCEAVIQKKQLAGMIDQKDKIALKEMLEEIKRTNHEIIHDLIEPTFAEMITGIPSRFLAARNAVEKRINEKIDDSGKLREEEMMTYINCHMLQYETKKQVNEIRFYIEAKLNELDRQISDRLNKEYAKIENTIELHFSVEAANMVKSMFKNVGGRALEQSLMNYFKQFAGKGGTGIANASKHLLKKFGEAFGKTFSRETHNKLASTLSKIGATSAKAVGIAVAVVIDVVFTITDIMTWQGKLKKSVRKGLDKWYDEVVTITVNDLKELKDENIALINHDTEEWIKNFDIQNKDTGVHNLEILQNLLNKTKMELGEYNYDE